MKNDACHDYRHWYAAFGADATAEESSLRAHGLACERCRGVTELYGGAVGQLAQAATGADSPARVEGFVQRADAQLAAELQGSPRAVRMASEGVAALRAHVESGQTPERLDRCI